MPRLAFAILAHAHRSALVQLVDDLRRSEPDSLVVVYNGGTDHQFLQGVDAPVCPYSRPLHHDWITPFPWDVMRWLDTRGDEFDYLVALECDMLLLRPGFGASLPAVMAGSDYMASYFGEISSWRHPWSVGRRAYWQWRRAGWDRLLGTDRPYGCFGPGQVMSRRYIDRLLAMPGAEQVMERAQRSRLRALYEVVYPTLAVSLGCNPIANPASAALKLRRHPAADLIAYTQDPGVHLIHKVGLRPQDPDRRFVREFCRTGQARPDLLDGYSTSADGPVASLRRVRRRAVRRSRRLWRDVAALVLPEQRPGKGEPDRSWGSPAHPGRPDTHSFEGGRDAAPGAGR